MNMSAEKDELICELFSLLKELSDLRRRYDRCTSEGYVSLAKTRYNIGSRAGGTISQLQYPNEMKATLLIDCDMMSPDMFQVTSGQDSEKFNEGDQQPSSQLRQRRVKGEVPQQSKDTSPVDTIQTVGGMDPIRWFSALPPMSLRNAQKRFKEGLQIAVLMASVHSRIDKVRQKFIEMTTKTEENEPETLGPNTD